MLCGTTTHTLGSRKTVGTRSSLDVFFLGASMRDCPDASGFLRARLHAKIKQSSGPFSRCCLQPADIVDHNVHLNIRTRPSSLARPRVLATFRKYGFS
jgi:hypothetical protein